MNNLIDLLNITPNRYLNSKDIRPDELKIIENIKHNQTDIEYYWNKSLEFKNKNEHHDIDKLKNKLTEKMTKYYDKSQANKKINKKLMTYYNFATQNISCKDVILGFTLEDYKTILFDNLIYLLQKDGYLLIKDNKTDVKKLKIFILIFLIFEKQSEKCLEFIFNKMFENFHKIIKLNGNNTYLNLTFMNYLHRTITKLYNNIIQKYRNSLVDIDIYESFPILGYIIKNVKQMHSIDINNLTNTKYGCSFFVSAYKEKIILTNFDSFYNSLKQSKNQIKYSHIYANLLQDNNVYNILVYLDCYIQILINYCNRNL